MRPTFLFVFLFLVATAASAQFKSRLGRFQVDQVKGCAPFTVTITNTNLITSGECTPGKPCLMDFQGKGSTSSNLFSFTYATPGTYKLSVLYQSIGADDITITVVANTAPTFEVYTCTGNQVSLKVTDKTYDTYMIDFNSDNVAETTIPSGNNAVAQHNYGAPGTYNITVRGKNVNSADNCQNKVESYQTLTVLPQPSINLMTALDANNLKLDMTTAPHIQYRLEIAINNASNFQVFQNLYQVNTITIPNLLVDNNYYCFRVSAFDPCAGTNTYSNVICSQNFDVNFINGVNDLFWQTSTGGITSVTINRNQSAYSIVPGAPLGFQDFDYDCNRDYCYQLVVNYASGRRSISLEKCGTGILQTTFPAIENVTSVVRNGVELTWEADPNIDIASFDIMRSMFRQPLVKFDNTVAETYTDATYTYEGGLCYQINYGDQCNNRSLPGIVACPIGLSGSLDEKNAVSLIWNSYKGYKNGVSTYRVDKYNKTAVLIGSYTTTDTTFVDYDPADNEQVVLYVITAIPTDAGIPPSISNNIKLEKPVRLITPTAFTPNGDGINQLFTISGKFVSKMTLQIFDRWGTMVFSTDKNEPWDGTKEGKLMPESAYVWKAEVIDTAGNTFSQEGTVLLLLPPR